MTTAYFDGELCGMTSEGLTSFALIQAATDGGAGALVYFAFDLLFIDGEAIGDQPLAERKARLEKLLKKPPAGIAYSKHEGADGELWRRAARTGSKASSPNASTSPTSPASVAPGSRANA